jgi:TonB family protein
MLEPLFSTPILYTLALTLLHFLWQGLLISAVLKLALLLIDQSKPQLRYVLCALAMLTNLLVVIITFTIISPETSSVSSNNLAPIPLTSLVSELTQQSTLLNYQELFPSILAYVLPYISLIWLTIVFILVCKVLVEIRNVNLLPDDESTLPSVHLQTRFNELAQQLNLHKIPRLLISMKAEVPMAIGFLKPVVLIPATMVTGLTPSQLEMLILHELAHIRRHDYLVNFLQTLIEILFFFHPSVHWVAKCMRNEREYCSDDVAVRHCGDPIAYAHTLTDTASLCHHHQQTIPNMAMAASGGDLKQRIVRLVNHHCTPRNDTGKWFAAISLLLVIAVFAINQLLSNASPQQWMYHLPWKNQYPSAIKSVQEPIYQSNSESSFVKNQKNSIAQQLLTTESNKSSMIAINKMYVKDQMPIANNIITNTVVPLDLLGKQKHSHTITSTESPNIKSALSQESSLVTKIKVNMKNEGNPSQSLLASESNTDNNIGNSVPTILASEFTPANIMTQEPIVVLNTNETDIINTDKVPQENNPLAMDVNSINKVNHYLKDLNNPSIQDSYVTTESLLKTNFSRQFKQSNVIINSPNSLNISEREYVAQQLTSVTPIYPSVAKRKGIEIEVKVHFTIDKNGQVKDINFTRKSQLNYFKNAIRTAMRKWRFIPAKVNNKAIESEMAKIFSFSLLG